MADSKQASALKLQLDSVRARLGRLTDLFVDGSLQQTVFQETKGLHVGRGRVEEEVDLA